MDATWDLGGRHLAFWIGARRVLKTHRVFAASVFAAMVLATSCGGGDDGAGPLGDDADSPSSLSSAPATSEAATGTTSTSTPQAPTSTVVTETQPLIDGVPLLRALTPTADVGIRPVLEWEPVAGAATYRAVVLDSEGQATWMWTGDEVTVPYGGALFPQDHGDGPVVGAGSTWSVVALDDRREVLAISERRPLEP